MTKPKQVPGSQSGRSRICSAVGLAGCALSKPKAEYDPILMRLRSASHPLARMLFREMVEQTFVTPLAAWLVGPEAQARARAIAGELLDLAVLTDVVESAELIEHEALVVRAARALQCHVDAQG